MRAAEANDALSGRRNRDASERARADMPAPPMRSRSCVTTAPLIDRDRHHVIDATRRDPLIEHASHASERADAIRTHTPTPP